MSNMDAITKLKYDAAFGNIKQALLNDWPILPILQDERMQAELGKSWQMLIEADYGGGRRRYKEPLLSRAIRDKDNSLALFLIDKLDNEHLQKKSFLGTPLEQAVRNGMVEVSLKLLSRLDDAHVRPQMKDLLAAAYKTDKRTIVEALEERASYVSPHSLSTVSPSAPLSFPDTKIMIAKALASGRASDALLVGSDILSACSHFFESIQKKGYESLTTGLKAGTEMADLSQRIARTHQSLQEIGRDPSALLTPPGFKGTIITAMRAVVPSLDPHRNLSEDFSDISQTVKQSLSVSQKVMRGYEDFQAHAPNINDQLTELRDELTKAIDTLDTDIASTTGPEAAGKERLRDIFSSIRDNAAATALFVEINSQTTETMLDTETRFATSVMGIQTALGATFTNASLVMAQIKAATTPVLQAQAGEVIAEQLDKAGQNLLDLRSLIDDRQDSIGVNTAKLSLAGPTAH